MTITNVWNSNASYPQCSHCPKTATCYYSYGDASSYYACEDHDPTLAPNWLQLRPVLPYFTYGRNVLPTVTFNQGTEGWLPVITFSQGGRLPAASGGNVSGAGEAGSP